MAVYGDYAKKYRELYPNAPEDEIKRGWEKDFGDYGVGDFGSDLKRAYSQFVGQGVGGAVEWMGGPSSISDYWRGVAERNPEHHSTRGRLLLEEPGMLTEPAFWGNTLAQIGTQVPYWFAGGMAGSALSKAMNLGRVTGALSGGAIAGGIPETMPEFSQALAEGMDPTEARLRSIPSIAAVSALNALPMDSWFGAGTKGLARRFMRGGASEALTEWAEEPAQALAWGRDPIEAMKQGVNVIPAAFLGGGGMGVATQASQRQDVPRGTPARQAYYDPDTKITIPGDIMEAVEEAVSRPVTNEINTPERTQMREELVEKTYGEGAKLKEKRIDIVMGPPAAGKSSAVAEPLAEKYGSIIIDADIVKEQIPEFDNGMGANAVHEESSEINNEVLRRALMNDDNIVLPVVGKSIDTIRTRLANLNKLGYNTNVHYVDLPLEKSVERAVNRFHETGRMVNPLYILKDVGRKPAENYEILKQEGQANEYHSYTNDVPFGQPAQETESYQPVHEELGGDYRPGSEQGDRGRFESQVAESERLTLANAIAAGAAPVSRAYEFYSPNTGEDMPFEESLSMLKSGQQALARAIAEDIDQSVPHETLSAVGDWADGSENSFVTEYWGADEETLRYLGAKKGKQFNQKAVLPFYAEEGGNDALYIMEVNDSAEGARKVLADNGIDYRTVAPIGDNKVRIYVVDDGSALLDNIEKVGDHYDTEIDVLEGRADWSLGGESRAEGLKAYESVIQARESAQVPQSDQGGGGPGQRLPPTGGPQGPQGPQGPEGPGRPATTPERVAEVGAQQATEEAKRGVITWEETERLAQALGTDAQHLKHVMDRELGKTFNVEELHGAANAVRNTWDAGQRYMEVLSEKIRLGTETPGDMAKAAELFAHMGAATAQYSGAGSETARALNIMRQHTDVREKINAFKGIATGIKSDADLRAAITAMAHIEDPGKAAKAARKMFEITNFDKFMEWYYMALLSGIPTHVVNITSTGLQAAVQELDTVLAATIGSFTNAEDAITWNEVKARWSNIAKGAMFGLNEAARVFRDFEKADFEEFGPIKDDRPHKRAFGGIFGQAVRIPMRLLSAEDTFWKGMLYTMGIAQMAEAESQATGRSVEDLTANPTERMTDEAWKQAKRGTFTEEAGAIGKSIQNFRRKVPLANLIFPFVQTPANIVKTALKHSIAAPLFTEVREDIRAGGRRAHIALAKVGIGTAISAAVYGLAAAGKVTGSAPEDPNERRLWYQQGFQPNSIRVGDTWVSFSRLEPLGMLMGIAADVHRLGKMMDTAEIDEIYMTAIGSLVKNLASKTYLRGLTEFINMVQEPERYGDKYFQRFASTLLVPTGIAYTARASDDRMRQVEGLLDAIKARTPGLRETLPERLDIYGNPIMEEGSGAYRMISPAYLKKMKDDPVAKELLELDVSFPAVGKKYRGVELSPESRNQLIKMTGKPTYNALRRVVASPNYKNLPDPYKKYMLQEVIDKTRRAGRLYWSMYHPEIMREALMKSRENKFGVQ